MEQQEFFLLTTIISTQTHPRTEAQQQNSKAK